MDERAKKAEQAAANKALFRRKRFHPAVGRHPQVNCELEGKTRTFTDLKV